MRNLSLIVMSLLFMASLSLIIGCPNPATTVPGMEEETTEEETTEEETTEEETTEEETTEEETTEEETTEEETTEEETTEEENNEEPPEDPPATYVITYHPNGADSGTVPSDTADYSEGDQVTIKGNEGALEKDGYFFEGWNTVAEGTGTVYQAGSTLSMPAEDVTLYALWFDPRSRLLPDDTAAGDQLGYSVAIDGDYMIVGAVKDDDNGRDSGSAYIYHKTGANTWDDGVKITAPAGEAGDCFGNAVAISGDYAVVGAYAEGGLYDSEWSYGGSAYVFHRTGENSWDEGVKIKPPQQYVNLNFGWSVAIDGDYVVVGANGDYGYSEQEGTAYIFKRNGTNSWGSVTQILAPDSADYARFGCSVDISGDYVVVGASQADTPSEEYGDIPSGAAYIFMRTDTGTNSWDDGVKLVPNNGAGFEQGFGYSVAIDGDYVTVGAFLDEVNGRGSGAAYIYRRTGENQWDEGTKISNIDGEEGDTFGKSVAIIGDTVAVGAHNDDTTGSVSFFKLTGDNSWEHTTKFSHDPGGNEDYFGSSVALSPEYAVIGAPGDDDNGENSGSLWLYQREY